MKKAFLVALAVLMLVSSLTACGNKKANYDEDGYSRVLYDDSDAESSEDEEEEADEKTETDKSTDSQTDTDSAEDNTKLIESRASDTDSDKNTTSSKKSSSSAASSKAASSANNTAASSKSISSKSGTVSASPASKASTPSSSSTVSSDYDTDTSSDSDTDTEWFDSENDSTDSDFDSDSDTDTDSDSEIEKGTFEYDDMTFPINGSSIEVGQDFETADELLGGPNDKVGNVYYYDECEITTNGDEDEEIITKITIISSNYYISKDIRIGSTTEDLLVAFGDAEYGYTYTLDERTLNFVVVNDVVTEISFS